MFKMLKKLVLIYLSLIGYFSINADWSIIEKQTQKAVVQVWVQGARFNWAEPYKAPDPFTGAGSGFFINETDLLTNYHVVKGQKSVYITMPFIGHWPLQVTVIGVCPEIDVALLKLTDDSYNYILNKCGEISWLPLGDSDKLYRTEPVLAVGFPLGFTSAKCTLGNLAGREFLHGSSYMHVTSPINPGNSGGPSLNQYGEVIGINTAGIIESQNIGYIVPINHVKTLLNDLYSIKFYRKPSLGIKVNHGTEEHAKMLNNPVPSGVYIYDIEKESVADKIGIQKGDMLYEINTLNHKYLIDEYGDVKVDWSAEKISVSELLVRFRFGKKLKLVVWRNGERKEFDCSFDSSPKHPIRYIYPDLEPEEIDYEMFAGACFMQLRENHFEVLPKSAAFRALCRTDKQDKEIIVMTNLLPGSLMHKVGCLVPGSLIKTINNKEIKNLTDLRDALKLSIETKMISITTKDDVSTVLSLTKVLEDEPRLARDFIFPISKTIIDIYKAVTAQKSVN